MNIESNKLSLKAIVYADLSEKGTYVEYVVNSVIYRSEMTINSEILIHRFNKQGLYLGWVIGIKQFKNAVSILDDKNLIIEMHPNTFDKNFVFSFAVKSVGMNMFLRRSDLYLRIIDAEKINESLWEFLDKLYPSDF